jgi:hypothetical protein
MTARPPTPLERFFAAVWEYAREGEDIAAGLLDYMLEKATLIEYRPADAAQAEASGGKVWVGDPMMHLTDAGREALAVVCAAKPEEPA